jgi:hypothetical protein
MSLFVFVIYIGPWHVMSWNVLFHGMSQPICFMSRTISWYVLTHYMFFFAVTWTFQRHALFHDMHILSHDMFCFTSCTVWWHVLGHDMNCSITCNGLGHIHIVPRHILFLTPIVSWLVLFRVKYWYIAYIVFWHVFHDEYCLMAYIVSWLVLFHEMYWPGFMTSPQRVAMAQW